MENSMQMASLSSSNNNYGENINIPFSVLKELNKALSDSANVISENTKALSELRNDRDKLAKHMKELKDEFKELKQQLVTKKPLPYETEAEAISVATRKHNLEDEQSSNVITYEKKTKIHHTTNYFKANFYSLSDDLLSHVLEFVGERCYGSFGLINTRCNQIFTKKTWAKKTFMFGYAPFSMICKHKHKEEWPGDGSKAICYGNIAKGIVKYNRLDVLRYLIRSYEKEKLSHVCELSALECRFDIMREVLDKCDDEVISYLKEDRSICEKAAKGNNFELLKWLHAQAFYWDEETFNAAAKNGNLSMLKWMFANDRNDIDEYELYELCEKAAGSGNLEMLKWLQSQPWISRFDLTMYGVAYNAALNRHLQAVRWLNDQGCDFTEMVFAGAAEGGSVEILEYLKAQDCPWDKDELCGDAALNGHLDALKWLKDQGCTLDTNTFVCAVYSDNIEILEWLRENNCPWNGKALVEAYRHNNRKALQWLIDNGCPQEYPEEEDNQFL